MSSDGQPTHSTRHTQSTKCSSRGVNASMEQNPYGEPGINLGSSSSCGLPRSTSSGQQTDNIAIDCRAATPVHSAIRNLKQRTAYSLAVVLHSSCGTTFMEASASHTHKSRPLPNLQKGLDSLIMLVAWQLWKERNARVFNTTTSPAAVVVRHRVEEAACRLMAEHAIWRSCDNAKANSFQTTEG